MVNTLGNLTQTGALMAARPSFVHRHLAANATITLNSANLLTGAVALNTNGATGDASLTNAKATVLGRRMSAAIFSRSRDQVGNLTQTGVLTVAGTSAFTTSANNATMTLTSANLLTGAAFAEHDRGHRQREPDQRQGDGARRLRTSAAI